MAHSRPTPNPVGVKVPAHQRFVLPNGLTIILVPKKEVPLIAFSGFVRGGALGDPAAKPGVASLVAGLLDRGAGKRSAFEFADAVEGVGGSFNAGAGAESISVSGQFLARDRALMIELLGDALMRPRFEADEFAKYRDRQIEFIKSAKDSDPSAVAVGVRAGASCSARIPMAVRRAAASARWPRSRRPTWWATTPPTSAPIARHWFSPATSTRSG